MNDIITTMFNKKFLEELFKPQELYSKKALRTVFDRLAHASIMRLNQASMDKVTSGILGSHCKLSHIYSGVRLACHYNHSAVYNEKTKGQATIQEMITQWYNNI